VRGERSACGLKIAPCGAEDRAKALKIGAKRLKTV
jgi:hypothetical protein